MRKVILFTSGVAVALVLGAAAVDAQRGRGGVDRDRPAVRAEQGQRGPAFARGPGRGGPAAFGRGLELTEDQQTQLQDLRSSARDQSAPIADALHVAQNALHRAIFADTRNDAEVGELASKVASLEQQLAALRLANEQAVADVLTADQKEIVRTQPRGRRGGRR